jgi:hypothetical protein
LSFLNNQILSIPDVQLRDAVTAQLDKKLKEYQEEAAQAQTAEAQSIIEKIGLDKYFDDISKQPGIGAKIKPSPETQAQIDEYEIPADHPFLVDFYNIFSRSTRLELDQ